MRRTRPIKRPAVASKRQASASAKPDGASRAGTRWVLVAVLVLITCVASYYFLRDRGAAPPAPVTATDGIPGGAAGQKDSGAAPGNNPPVVLSAIIAPENATAKDTLGIQYSGDDPEGDPVNYRFRWTINGSAIQDGPASTLGPGAFRKGDAVQAEVTPSDPTSFGETFLTQHVMIGNQPPAMSDVILNPAQPFIGTTMTAVPTGSDPDGDSILYTYHWHVNGTAVENSSAGNTFNTNGLRKHDTVFVSVTGSDGTSSSDTVVSGVVTIGNRLPRITSTPPSGLLNGVLSYQVTASDQDGDPLSFSLLSGPRGATIDSKSGLLRWEVPKGVMFTGKQVISVRVAVGDGDGGGETQEFSLTLQDVLVY